MTLCSGCRQPIVGLRCQPCTTIVRTETDQRGRIVRGWNARQQLAYSAASNATLQLWAEPGPRTVGEPLDVLTGFTPGPSPFGPT
jgi:hypothetical protein